MLLHRLLSMWNFLLKTQTKVRGLIHAPKNQHFIERKKQNVYVINFNYEIMKF